MSELWSARNGLPHLSLMFFTEPYKRLPVHPSIRSVHVESIAYALSIGGIPSIGPIRAAVLLGILQTPHRFRSKRQLCAYGGVGIETHSSADHHVVKGPLERKKKQVEIRGLNRNHNHDLKNLFKGAAIVAATKPGPFAEFYAELLAKGTRPEMARLTLARKIATIVLIVWKRGVSFDAQHLKPQTA
jgi:transposase IS116/IS110/IS902 family protein